MRKSLSLLALMSAGCAHGPICVSFNAPPQCPPRCVQSGPCDEVPSQSSSQSQRYVPPPTIQLEPPGTIHEALPPAEASEQSNVPATRARETVRWKPVRTM